MGSKAKWFWSKPSKKEGSKRTILFSFLFTGSAQTGCLSTTPKKETGRIWLQWKPLVPCSAWQCTKAKLWSREVSLKMVFPLPWKLLTSQPISELLYTYYSIWIALLSNFGWKLSFLIGTWGEEGRQARIKRKHLDLSFFCCSWVWNAYHSDALFVFATWNT